jgi:hypothetical protein
MSLFRVLRKKRPDLPRAFHCPGVPAVPALAIAFCLVLMAYLKPITWIAFEVWLALGAFVYFAYARHKSVLQAEATVQGYEVGERQEELTVLVFELHLSEAVNLRWPIRCETVSFASGSLSCFPREIRCVRFKLRRDSLLYPFEPRSRFRVKEVTRWQQCVDANVR